MRKVAMICAILEEPEKCQMEFNDTVSEFKGLVRGRMGLPLPEGVAAISITVVGEMDEINSLTGRLGNIEHVSVKSAISKKEI